MTFGPRRVIRSLSPDPAAFPHTRLGATTLRARVGRRHAASVTLSEAVERRRIRVRGVVQGVGFRPFVHRIATRGNLAGSVWNDGDGVVVEVEGAPEAVDAFARALVDEAPPLARVASVAGERVEPLGEHAFVVASSHGGGRSALVPPDVATCDDCLRELFDPTDRRYRYPFVNCTNCGPRLHDRHARPVRPAEHDDGRLPALRRLPARVRGSRPTAASTPSRSRAPPAGRTSRCRSSRPSPRCATARSSR